MGLLLFGKEVVTFCDVHAFVFPFTSSRFFTPLLVSPLPPPFPLLTVLSSVIFKKIPTFFPGSSLASILATSIQFAWPCWLHFLLLYLDVLEFLGIYTDISWNSPNRLVRLWNDRTRAVASRHCWKKHSFIWKVTCARSLSYTHLTTHLFPFFAIVLPVVYATSPSLPRLQLLCESDQ